MRRPPRMPKSPDRVSPQISAFQAPPKTASQEALFSSSTLPKTHSPLLVFLSKRQIFHLRRARISFLFGGAPTHQHHQLPQASNLRSLTIKNTTYFGACGGHNLGFALQPRGGEERERERRAFTSFSFSSPPRRPHPPPPTVRGLSPPPPRPRGT